MAYNYFPVGYQNVPQNYPQFQQSYPQNYPQQQNGIVWVQGIEGAKAHPVAAGQAVLLMDSDSNCLYLKSADNTGLPSLRIFDYTERTSAPTKDETVDLSGFISKDDISHYVTKDELKKAVSDLKKELKGKNKNE